MRNPWNDSSQFRRSHEQWEKDYESLKEHVEKHDKGITLLPNGWVVPKEGYWDLYYLDLLKSIDASLWYSLERLDDVSRNLHLLCPYCNGHEDIEEIIKLTEELKERIRKIKDEGKKDIKNQLKANKTTIKVVNTLEDDK